MNKENTEKLMRDFPTLYRGYKKPLTESLMGFGFECRDGWFQLIYDLSKELVAMDSKLEAVQVKEKYGTLRFYVGGATDAVFNLIFAAEEKSSGICEVCGSMQDVKTGPDGGWVRTLCGACRGKEEKEDAD